MYLMVAMMWYSILLAGWVIYGICWIYYMLFKLCAKGIKRLFQKHPQE